MIFQANHRKSAENTVLLICSFLLIFLHGKAAWAAPTISDEAIGCLQNQNWHCALDHLIPEYYDSGQDGQIGSYIAHAYRNLAETAADQQQYSQAAAELEEAINYVADDHRLYGELGQLYFLLSHYDKAESSLNTAWELYPESTEYPTLLGRLRYLQGDLQQAISLWEHVLSKQPNNQRLALNLQRLKRQLQTEKEGTTQFSHLVKITFDGEVDPELYGTVMEMFEDIWYETGQQLDIYPGRQIPVLLLTRKKFTSMTDAPQWSAGLYEGQIKIPVAQYDERMLREVVRHEYLHAVIYDIMANRCPWWLNEGLAQYYSMDEDARRERLQIARDVKQQNGQVDLARLPGDLNDSQGVIASYALALSATDFLHTRFPIGYIRLILLSMREGMTPAEAFSHHTGYTFEEFQHMWLTSG